MKITWKIAIPKVQAVGQLSFDQITAHVNELYVMTRNNLTAIAGVSSMSTHVNVMNLPGMTPLLKDHPVSKDIQKLKLLGIRESSLTIQVLSCHS